MEIDNNAIKDFLLASHERSPRPKATQETSCRALLKIARKNRKDVDAGSNHKTGRSP